MSLKALALSFGLSEYKKSCLFAIVLSYMITNVKCPKMHVKFMSSMRELQRCEAKAFYAIRHINEILKNYRLLNS